MSSATLPALPGLGWNIERTEMWNNSQQEAVSGADTLIAYWSYPKHQFKVIWNFLRQGTIDLQAYSEMETLCGFFNLRKGSFDSFLYTADDDNTVTGQELGDGDGATTAFQLVKSFGGFTEPVLAPNVVSAVYVNSVLVSPVAAPTTGSLSTSAGGSLAATTYYVRSTWVTATGETAASTETTQAALIDTVLNVAHPTGSPPAGATGWNVYVSNTAGGGANHEEKQNASPIAVGTAWVQPTSGLVAGAAYPATDQHSAWNYSVWGATTPGILTFAAAPGAYPIQADFSYYYPCRFDNPTMAFTKFLAKLYSQGGITFTSIKYGVGA